MANKKVVNVYALVAVAGQKVEKVKDNLGWAQTKAEAKNVIDNYDSVNAVETWKDADGVTHFKAWALKKDAKGEITFSLAYSFTDADLSKAAAAMADVSAL